MNRPTYFADVKPLHTIVSMTAYAELRRRPVPPGRIANPPAHAGAGNPTPTTLLALGDPVYAESSDDSGRGLKLAALPGTRREVQAIAQLFGKQAAIRLGAEASEATARKELSSASLIHLACHGILDQRSPLDSGLALSADETNDGLLQAWEIFEKVRMNADLVVLSACQTGLGRTTKQEGVVGLTRALQYAGAKSIVVSLWSVSDDSTAALMTVFYTELKKGTNKDVALQRAMATVRKHPKWSHPFFWAPFVLIGDWH
jgi:CHAT domain-containing protein